LKYRARHIPAATKEDVEFLCGYLEMTARHPNQLLYGSKVLISTFAGDQSTFGKASVEEGWSYARKRLEKIAPVGTAPSIPKMYA